MGVPSFYKYIRNAYKERGIGLSDTCPNHVDRLYLDFNGIIHTCKEDVLKENGTEKDIHKAVLSYNGGHCFEYVYSPLNILVQK